MPGPAVYAVIAVVGTVAAGVAFYEFVYEPHIAPKLEQWAENFIARRRARRRQRAGLISVPASSTTAERGNSLFNGKNWDSSTDSETASDEGDSGDTKVYEMESLVNRNIFSWRTNSSGDAKDGLRHRKTGTSSTIDEPVGSSMNYPLLHPTHVISGSISASEASSPQIEPPVADRNSYFNPNTDGDTVVSTSRSSNLGAAVPAVPAPSSASRTVSMEPSRVGTPAQVASLSLSHPVDLVEFDAEQDLQVISAPSSRASSRSRIHSDDLDARFSLSSSDDEASRASSRLSMTEGSEMFFSIHENATSGLGSNPRSRSSTNSFSGLTSGTEDDVISVASGDGSEIFSESSWDNVGSAGRR